MYYKDYDYGKLDQIRYCKKTGYNRGTYNNCYIAFDTETSKKVNSIDNHIVAFSFAIRYDHHNICCIHGMDPDEMMEAFDQIRSRLKGHDIFIWVHNLAYDWVFIRKFLINAYGEPIKQLNTKPHYPIYIEFENGIILKDSLILSACNLDKWATDLDVEHQKAIGNWDYDKIRDQHGEVFSDEEVVYIENDVLSLVECLDTTAVALHKHPFSMPYTNTGIVRRECKEHGRKNKAHEKYLNICADFYQNDKLMYLFHGGYTHGNRFYYGRIITSIVKCYDFASSYPFCMLAYKFPMSKFQPIKDLSIQEILKLKDKYAFMFKLILIRPKLKDPYHCPMPVLQFSKCTKCINPVLDNGRVTSADYIEIMITEMDLAIIEEQYAYDAHICTEIEYAFKRYLPRWFTDYVYELFKAKSELKNGDPIQYGIAKAKLNSCYGMCVQKPLKDDIVECYGTGEFEYELKYNEENYNKYIKKQSSILPYQWGVWVTAYAQYNLFQLGKCIQYDRGGEWLYSDTDSIYGYLWDDKKVNAYNQNCIDLLKANGYEGVKVGKKIYHLGIATLEKVCKEFIYLDAKRYAYRDDEGLHITVAGVPKKGSKCLGDRIEKFVKGFCFPGKITGKKQITYNFVDDIYIDMRGNITGDSINLDPCDYILDQEDWSNLQQDSIPLDYTYE